MSVPEINEAKARFKLRALADARRPSFSDCNCGRYTFPSAACPRGAAETEVKCGLNESDLTGRPIFCTTPAPNIMYSDYRVSAPCKDCKSNNAFAGATQGTWQAATQAPQATQATQGQQGPSSNSNNTTNNNNNNNTNNNPFAWNTGPSFT